MRECFSLRIKKTNKINGSENEYIYLFFDNLVNCHYFIRNAKKPRNQETCVFYFVGKAKLLSQADGMIS